MPGTVDIWTAPRYLDLFTAGDIVYVWLGAEAADLRQAVAGVFGDAFAPPEDSVADTGTRFDR